MLGEHKPIYYHDQRVGDYFPEEHYAYISTVVYNSAYIKRLMFLRSVTCSDAPNMRGDKIIGIDCQFPESYTLEQFLKDTRLSLVKEES